MRAVINFIRGLKAIMKVKRMVFLLFVINMLFSMILAFPMYNSLKNSFGHSLAGDRMVKGFDYLWWEEFRDQSAGFETSFNPTIIGKGAILNNLEGLIQMHLFQLP